MAMLGKVKDKISLKRLVIILGDDGKEYRLRDKQRFSNFSLEDVVVFDVVVGDTLPNPTQHGFLYADNVTVESAGSPLEETISVSAVSTKAHNVENRTDITNGSKITDEIINIHSEGASARCIGYINGYFAQDGCGHFEDGTTFNINDVCDVYPVLDTLKFRYKAEYDRIETKFGRDIAKNIVIIKAESCQCLKIKESITGGTIINVEMIENETISTNAFVHEEGKLFEIEDDSGFQTNSCLIIGVGKPMKSIEGDKVDDGVFIDYCKHIDDIKPLIGFTPKARGKSNDVVNFITDCFNHALENNMLVYDYRGELAMAFFPILDKKENGEKYYCNKYGQTLYFQSVQSSRPDLDTQDPLGRKHRRWNGIYVYRSDYVDFLFEERLSFDLATVEKSKTATASSAKGAEEKQIEELVETDTNIAMKKPQPVSRVGGYTSQLSFIELFDEKNGGVYRNKPFIDIIKATALKEYWGQNDDILCNYLEGTYRRLEEEGGKILPIPDSDMVLFDTGLLSKSFTEIRVCASKTEKGFENPIIAPEGYVENFGLLPETADYFDGNYENILFDANAGVIIAYEHIFAEKMLNGKSQGIRPERIGYFAKKINDTKNNPKLFRQTKSWIEDQINIALTKAQKMAKRDYKYAIPGYHLWRKENSFYLPLFFATTHEPQSMPDCVLVIRNLKIGIIESMPTKARHGEIKGSDGKEYEFTDNSLHFDSDNEDELSVGKEVAFGFTITKTGNLIANSVHINTGKNKYEGITILTCEWAYNSARLLAKPGVPWLNGELFDKHKL